MPVWYASQPPVADLPLGTMGLPCMFGVFFAFCVTHKDLSCPQRIWCIGAEKFEALRHGLRAAVAMQERPGPMFLDILY